MIIRGNMEGVKLLVGHGVDLDMPSIRGMTPIKIVVECGYLDIASYMIDHGAKVPEDHDFFVSCAKPRSNTAWRRSESAVLGGQELEHRGAQATS
jgi:ankyrin repeat protein